ncbi:MAG TPA: BON domain-containing protein [Kiloniellaceae bacterium]
MTMKRSPLLAMLLFVTALLAVPLAGCSGETAGEYVDDSVISNTVRAKLIDDSDLNMFQIDVTTLKGEVQLSGFVDSEAAKARAGSVAAGVDGVREVHNNLVVQ